MNETRQRIEARLAAFQVWRGSQAFTSARLVQYCGGECTGAFDVPLGEVEEQLRGCLEEGFDADWHIAGGKLYLCIYESLDEPPDRTKVVAEESIVDGEATLRDAGFEPNDNRGSV